MKAYDLAKSLTHLARVLRAGPNVDVMDIGNLSVHTAKREKLPKSDNEKAGGGERGAALALLAEMANYSKGELIDLALQLDIPIQVRKADAVRDILGKILKYIQENPDARGKLVNSSKSTKDGSRLAQALAILMSQ